ncbi:hypothetical protein [Streptomyces anandii]|uniref:Uncharacterized protein n=1 Tax=Streptomyces naganishii JCM 4654 TaxID=1306179 RepID=A0A918YA23_9ACTN|nr:hypothetical protein [Streptomyces anandii]GGX99250.1 hypothetical protein GCM10010510_51070 [Streptomyces anandii JCM 4720]GHD95925.1 hypothetical protein GCM10010508_62580 [Streptomyces naganishii JCM 4654]
MLFVHGGPTTAVVRNPAGDAVVLLSGELPEVLTDQALFELLDLAAAILEADELVLFHKCLQTLRRNGMRAGRRIEIDGAVLTVYEG